MQQSPYIEKLIASLTKLPGIGEHTAARLSIWLLSRASKEDVDQLAQALVTAKDHVRMCSVCRNLTDSEVCPICSDPRRNPQEICVVESPESVQVLEQIGCFQGLYHVLHGLIDPSAGVELKDLEIRSLLERLRLHPEVEELTFALSSTVAGEATQNFISNLLQRTGIRLTGMATGVPLGTSLVYTDSVTLRRAFEQKRLIYGGEAERAADSLRSHSVQGGRPMPGPESEPESEATQPTASTPSLFDPSDFED